MAVLALVFSLFSGSVVYAAEEKSAAEPRYVKIAVEASDPEKLYGEYIPVLMYHHFAARDMGSGNGVVTTAEELEDHLRYFRSQGYKIITLEKLDSLLRKVEYDHRLTGKDFLWERNISASPWMMDITAIMNWVILYSRNIARLHRSLQ